jgi:hypothetical protein
MSKLEKVLARILRGTSDANIEFKELVSLLKKLGFNCRIKGSHHIFFKEGISEIINIQEISGKAKSYR